jgi:hypothetical protein
LALKGLTLLCLDSVKFTAKQGVLEGADGTPYLACSSAGEDHSLKLS